MNFETPQGNALIARVGYRYTLEPRAEFPPGTITARITGPTMEQGLPFPVPENDADVWARRWCLALSRAFEAGQQSSPESPRRTRVPGMLS